MVCPTCFPLSALLSTQDEAHTPTHTNFHKQTRTHVNIHLYTKTNTHIHTHTHSQPLPPHTHPSLHTNAPLICAGRGRPARGGAQGLAAPHPRRLLLQPQGTFLLLGNGAFCCSRVRVSRNLRVCTLSAFLSMNGMAPLATLVRVCPVLPTQTAQKGAGLLSLHPPHPCTAPTLPPSILHQHNTPGGAERARHRKPLRPGPYVDRRGRFGFGAGGALSQRCVRACTLRADGLEVDRWQDGARASER